MTSLDLLLEEPRQFQLGPALRLLGMATNTTDPLAGGDRKLAKVRICNRISPTIALHEIEKVEQAIDGTYDVITPILNIVGATGVLDPHVWYSIPRKHMHKVHQLTHKLVAIWYSGWISGLNRHDRLAASFARPRSAAGLEALLNASYQFPIQVYEGRGGWALTKNEQGKEDVVYDPVRWCELHAGPVNRMTFEALMPGGTLLEDVLTLARQYSGPIPRFRVMVELLKQDAQIARRGYSNYNRGAVVDHATGNVTVILRDEELPSSE